MEYTIENYINDNPKDGHTKLYLQFRMTTPEEDLEQIKLDNVLHFQLGGDIVYTITLKDLMNKVREENNGK